LLSRKLQLTYTLHVTCVCWEDKITTTNLRNFIFIAVVIGHFLNALFFEIAKTDFINKFFI